MPGAGNINNPRLWGVTVHITVLKQPAKGCKYNSVNRKWQIRRERLARTSRFTVETGTLGICKTEEARKAL